MEEKMKKLCTLIESFRLKKKEQLVYRKEKLEMKTGSTKDESTSQLFGSTIKFVT